MDNPTEDIEQVVRTLCQGTPEQQTEAINKYYTPNASFTHPFCRTGSFDGSRNLIHAIYKWYKLLSPKIELDVNSIGMPSPPSTPSNNPRLDPQANTPLPPQAYDPKNLILYLNITQLFSLWFIPFHHARVTLTVELHLTHPPNSKKFYIHAQNDLYQNDQLLRFAMPFGLAEFFMHLFQYSSTLMCVLGAFLLAPATKMQQQWLERRDENGSGSGAFANVEEEMRNLVSNAMEGVGYKAPEGRRRKSSGAVASGSGIVSGTGDREPGAGASSGAGASATGSEGVNGDVQQFGNMQVIT